MENFSVNQKIIIPRKGDKSHDLLNNLKSISDDDIMKIGEDSVISNSGNTVVKESGNTLMNELFNELSFFDPKNSIEGKKTIIVEFLKNNFVHREYSFCYGKWGDIVRFELPALGKFKGLKFDYFASLETLPQVDYNKRQEYEKISYSKSEIENLLKAFHVFLIEVGLVDKNAKVDDFDYLNLLGRILDFSGEYWLKDNKVFHFSSEDISVRKKLSFIWWGFYESQCDGDSDCGLLLKI